MLPDRSKRYAGIDGAIPRLSLALNWQLALVALLVLALLAVIFPRKALVEKLYAQETLDDLTLSYIRNLYRADANNADAAILLTKSQQNVLDIESMEARLLPLIITGDSRQRTEARFMMSRAYDKALAANPDALELKRLREQLTDMLQKAAQEKIPESLARHFASSSFELSLPALGLEFLHQAHEVMTAVALEQYGTDALARRQYGLAAEYFLMARDLAVNLDDSRRLFQKGVGALMAASRFQQALVAANQHLGNLENDSVTLRYLARTALAAGDPAQAAGYARKLVFMNQKPGRAP